MKLRVSRLCPFENQLKIRQNHRVVHYSHILEEWHELLFKEEEASTVILCVQLRIKS